MAVSSPCIRACCLDDDDVCLGCFRSLDEITAWGTMSDDERLRCLARCQQRKASRPAPPWRQWQQPPTDKN